jgi:hypothetical protein
MKAIRMILALVVVSVVVQSVQAWCSTCWVGTEPEEEKVVVDPLTNSEMMLAIMGNLAKGTWEVSKTIMWYYPVQSSILVAITAALTIILYLVIGRHRYETKKRQEEEKAGQKSTTTNVQVVTTMSMPTSEIQKVQSSSLTRSRSQEGMK